jgi:hypothetical protein
MSTSETPVGELTVPERLMLLCLASDTDWEKVAGLTDATVQRMIVRGLVERDRTTVGRFALTDQGHSVVAALLSKKGKK